MITRGRGGGHLAPPVKGPEDALRRVRALDDFIPPEVAEWGVVLFDHEGRSRYALPRPRYGSALELRGKFESVDFAGGEEIARMALDGRGAEFVRCAFGDRQLLNCDFRDARFIGCTFLRCEREFERAKWSGASFRGCEGLSESMGRLLSGEFQRR